MLDLGSRVNREPEARLGLITFGHWEMDEVRRILRYNGVRIQTERRTFDVLAIFVRNPGTLLSREEIACHLSRGKTVMPATIDKYIGRVRALIAALGLEGPFIITVPRRGYRFLESLPYL